MRLIFIVMIMAGIAFSAVLEERVLENGLTVIVSPDHASPIVTIVIVVKTGATCETPENNGLAHFYEHMFFKGNENLPDQTAYNARMRELGIVRNGTTSREIVRYYFTLESSLFEEGMEFMFNAITSPLFDMSEMEREREVIMNEYERNTTGAFWNLWIAQEKVIYADIPWRASVLGAPEVIMAANPEFMREFQDKYYTPDNCALIIAGDVGVDEAYEFAEKWFSSWEYGGRSDYDDLPVAISIPEDTTVYVTTPADIGHVQVVYAGPPMIQDASSTYAADVWGSYLDLMSRNFYRNLVTNGPFLQVYGTYFSQRFAPQITFAGYVAPDRMDEAVELLKTEIERLQDPSYYDLEGFEIAREHLRRHRLLSEETSSDLAIESLAFWWVVGGGVNYYETYHDSLAAVTIEDVSAFIQKYIAGKPSATFIVMPEVAAEEVSS